MSLCFNSKAAGHLLHVDPPFQDSSLRSLQPHWSGTIFFFLRPGGRTSTIWLRVYVHVYAGACLRRQPMGPLGCVKQEAPFYIRKLMMWFPQSWQLKYERQWAAQGGLPSPVLNDLHPHSNWGRPRQRVSACLRKDLSTVHPSTLLPHSLSCSARPLVPPGPDTL